MDIGTLVLKVTADTDAATKALGSFSGVLKGVGKAALIGAAAIGGGLALALKDGYDGVIAMENATSQLDAVLKSTGGAAGVTRDQAIKLAEAYQLTTKFTAESVMAAENMLLTFTNISKDVFPSATEAALNMATVFGTDAAGGAIQLGKALNNPTQGITALTRVGVTFTEEQKNTIKAMQDTGDMAGAQAIILAELTKEFGGSAEAAGKTFAGQLEIAKNAIGEMSEGLATTLMPSLQIMLDWVNSNMPSIQKVMTDVFNNVQIAVKYVYDFWVAYLLPVFAELFDWVQANMPTIKEVIKTTFTVMGENIKWAWSIISEKFIPILKRIWEIVEPQMPLIAAAFKLAFSIIKGVVEVTINIIEGIVSTIEDVKTSNDPILKGIRTAFEIAFGAIKLIVESVQKVLDAFNNTEVRAKNATVTNTVVTEYMTKYSSTSKGNPPVTGGRAFGGEVMAGKSYLVGEQGREVFTPSQSGSVSSGTGANITINVNGNKDANSTANEIVKILRMKGVLA